ncbi:MAG: PepSY-associated TM helix domain-containing protein [Parvibaculaceae bacterium]
MSASTVDADLGAPSTILYRAVWRWHFYAGLLVLPFLVLLATTGGLYLYKDEINGLLYGRYLHVTPSDRAALPPSQLVERALSAQPGEAVGYIPPAAPDRSAQVRVKDASGEKWLVFLAPSDGAVLGTLSDGGAAGTPFMLLLRKIHSLDYFGRGPNLLIEIVAGWAIILVVTGFYLWWPRGRQGGVFTIRREPGRRVFWRDLHAVTGACAGLFILFLAVTGLPWSGFWGAQLNTFADRAGLGYPPQFWNDVPKSDAHMGHAMTQTSWSLEQVPMPKSTPGGNSPMGLDKAVATFDGLGIHKGYAIDLPSGPEGVYSASVFPDKVAGERIVHLDQYSGKVLFDGGFAELGAIGKAIEWGISVHMGQEFGLLNQLLMTAACVSIVLMAVAAMVMWWRRRPKGSLGAPRLPTDARIGRGVLVIAAAFGIVFPLTGLSILAMLAIDWLLPRSLRQRLA